MAQAREIATQRADVGSVPTVINNTINGFVGSESQAAAKLDEMLTRRFRRNGLGFIK